MRSLKRFVAVVTVVGFCGIWLSGCGSDERSTSNETSTSATIGDTSTTISDESSQVAAIEIRVGAEVLADDGFASIEQMAVGVILNQASTVHGEPLLDVLAAADGVELVAVFGPEHGVRGDEPAGAAVEDAVDPATGVPVHSLYGATRKPTPGMLDGLDVLVFDLQDVGARVYTFISTMGLAMQAAAEAGIPFVVLDRPNPLGGDMVDGYVRSGDQESFVGLYPIPLVHGMTTGELATAIQAEGWLPGLEGLDLRVIEVEGWRRDAQWDDTTRPWVAPSPSLPTADGVAVYPGTVLLEATTVSVGRGTDDPFRLVGAPWVDADALATVLTDAGLPGVRFEPVTFTPTASPAVPNPPFADEPVNGVRVVVVDRSTFTPAATGVYLLAALRDLATVAGEPSIISSPDLLDLLAGTDALRTGLADGLDGERLVAAWEVENEAFDAIRAKYLRYD